MILQADAEARMLPEDIKQLRVQLSPVWLIVPIVFGMIVIR